MILIMSVLDDTHARAVDWGLQQRGVPASIIDTFPLPSSGQMSMLLEHDESPQLQIRSCDGRSRRIDPWTEVAAIWMRRFNPDYYDLADVHPLDASAVRSEVPAFVSGLFGMLDACPAIKINPHRASRRAADKAVQLITAQSVGLSVPRTLIGNEPDEVLAFASRCDGPIIFKPFFQEIWREDGIERVQHARIVDRSQLLLRDAVRLCPGIYQPYVPKAFELRAIVLGDHIRYVKIDSQQVAEAAVDWRGDFRQRCVLSEVDVPNHVSDGILHFMRVMDLSFGCIDLVVTPAGEYVFLEINDQGQFLWIEARNPAIGMLAAFTRFLARVAGHGTEGSWPTLAEYRQSQTCAEQQAQVSRRGERHQQTKQRLAAPAVAG